MNIMFTDFYNIEIIFVILKEKLKGKLNESLQGNDKGRACSS